MPTLDFSSAAVAVPDFSNKAEPVIERPKSKPLDFAGPRSTTYGGPPKAAGDMSAVWSDLSEELNNPRFTTPDLEIKPDDSIAMAAGKEAINIIKGVPEFLSSDTGLLSIAAGYGAPRVVSALFSLDMAKDLGKQILESHKDWNRMTASQKTKAVVDMAGSGIFGTLTGIHATRAPKAPKAPGEILSPRTTEAVASLGESLKMPKGATPSPAAQSMAAVAETGVPIEGETTKTLTPQTEAAAREVAATPKPEPKAEDATETRKKPEDVREQREGDDKGRAHERPSTGGGVPPEAEGAAQQAIAFDPAKTGPIAESGPETSDESVGLESTESLLKRTKPGEERDAAFSARAAALKRLSRSLKSGDVIVDEDGNRYVIDQVFSDGTIFFRGKSGEYHLGPEDKIERAKTGPITAAAYKDPKTGEVWTGPNHPAILAEHGVKGFDTRESRNTPAFGYVTQSGDFIPRAESSPIAKFHDQQLEPFEHGEGGEGQPGSEQVAAKPGGETPLSETAVAPQPSTEPPKPLPEAEKVPTEPTPAAKPLVEGEKAPTAPPPPAPKAETGKEGAGGAVESFPDLPKEKARFDQGPTGYKEDVAMQRKTDQGWEKYYDQSPEQRKAAFSQIVQNLSKGTSEEMAFARGWMDARDAAQMHAAIESEKTGTGPLTAQERVELNELRETRKSRGKLGDLNQARLEWLENREREEPAPQPSAKEGEAKPPGPSDVGPGTGVGPGMGGAIPSEFGEEGSIVSNIFAAIDADREARGLEPMPPAKGRSWDQDEKIAMTRLNRDPDWIPNLIKQVSENPRPLLSWEQAGMVFTKSKWKAEQNNALRKIAQAFEDGRQDDIATAKSEEAVWADKLQEMEDAVGRGGTGSEAGRSLQAQKMGVTDDFDLVEAVMHKRGARGGKELSNEEIAALKKEVDAWKSENEKYQKSLADREKRISDLESQRAMEEAKRATEAEKAPSKYIIGIAEKIGAALHERANGARARLKGKLLSVSPEDLKDIAEIGADVIYNTGLDLAKWSAKLLGEFADDAREKIRPYLDQIFKQSQDIVEKFAEKAAPKGKSEQVKRAINKQSPQEIHSAYSKTIREKLDKGEKGKLSYYLQKLARDLYAEGVTSRDEMVDRLTEIVQEESPNMSRQEVARAWSGYGDYRQLSHDEISVALRGMKGELQQIAKLEDMQAGQPPLKSGMARREPSEVEKKLIKLVNDAKNKFQIPISDPETQLKSSLDTLKASLKSRIEDYQDRLDRKDFAPRPRREIKLDEEALRLKAARDRIYKKFREGLIADRLKNRTSWEKAMDWATKVRRSEVLTSLTVIPKLASAGLARFGALAAEDVVGEVWSHIPGVSSISAKAPLEGGGVNLRADMRGYGAAFTKGLKDAYDVIKTGHSDLDVLYGKAAESYTGESELGSALIALPGRVHGMEKSPVKRQAFERAVQRLGEWWAQQMDESGKPIDINNPMVQSRIMVDAYKYANRQIFLQDNAIAAAVNAGLRTLEQKDKTTGKPSLGKKAIATSVRTELPIMRVPLNIAAETMSYAVGWATGGGKILAAALGDGVRNLKPEEADFIMRQLKKGTIGAAVMYLGYVNRHNIGGYYQPGQRGEKQVPWGNIRVFGNNIPSWLLHNPLLECLQIGATVGNIAESQLKRGGEKQGLTMGIMGAALGVADETPIVREASEIGKAMDPRERQRVLGQHAESLLVPAAVHQAAKWTDPAKKRNPKTVGQWIRSGIPGARETVPAAK